MFELKQDRQEENIIAAAAAAETFQLQNRIYDVTEGLRSKATKTAYDSDFKQFLNFIGTHDRQVLLDWSPRTVQDHIIDYVIHLRDVKKLQYQSIQQHLSAIFHFFDMNDYPEFKKYKIKRFLPPNESSTNTAVNDRPYTVEEIRTIFSECNDERSRVIILLMASTGMRIGAIHALQIGNLTKIPHHPYNLYKIQVYATSKKDRYYTFTTPECASAIDAYLDYRKRFGEELKDKSPLIREQFNIEDKLRIQSPRFLSERMIIHLVTGALKRSGINSKEIGVMRSHGFRKFYKSQTESSYMKSINVELLMGHSIGVSGHYYRPTEAEVLEDYLKAIDALTISSEHRLKKQMQQQQDKHSEEWAQLKAEMNELKRLMEPMK